ncbi:unnamed protein product, partial [Mesorhabditis belari]
NVESPRKLIKTPHSIRRFCDTHRYFEVLTPIELH